MICPYGYYKDNEDYPRLYCELDDTSCMYSKRCMDLQKFIPLDNQEECYKMLKEKEKNIPKNSYYIKMFRKNKNGTLYLYVQLGDKVERIPTKLDKIEQDYVYLKNGVNGYKVSLTPFSKEIKKTNKRQRKQDE